MPQPPQPPPLRDLMTPLTWTKLYHTESVLRMHRLDSAGWLTSKSAAILVGVFFFRARAREFRTDDKTMISVVCNVNRARDQRPADQQTSKREKPPAPSSQRHTKPDQKSSKQYWPHTEPITNKQRVCVQRAFAEHTQEDINLGQHKFVIAEFQTYDDDHDDCLVVVRLR